MKNYERLSARLVADSSASPSAPHRRLPSYGVWLLWAGALTTLIGCGERPQIRTYIVDADQEKVVTTDVLRNQFPVIPFRWKVPPSWRVADNDQFSVLAWSAGPPEPDKEARITLSELPASAGLIPQVTRWRIQIGMSEVEPAEAVKAVESLSLGSQSGSYVELRGSEETILGMIVIHDGKMWVFKYRSDNSTVSKIGPSFRSFCESLQINP